MRAGPAIAVLAETPHLATVAGWLHGEWWHAAGWSLAATAEFLESASGPSAPITWVATLDGQPAATATLDTDDLASRMDLSPWLASVFVAPGFRGRGLGRALAAHAIATARRLGHAELWLHTFTAEPYWRGFGFVPSGEERWAGGPTTLMRLAL